MLKLKLHYFGHLMQRTDSLEKTLLMLGKIEGSRKKGRQDFDANLVFCCSCAQRLCLFEARPPPPKKRESMIL